MEIKHKISGEVVEIRDNMKNFYLKETSTWEEVTPTENGEEPPVNGEEPPVNGEEPPVNGEEPPVKPIKK